MNVRTDSSDSAAQPAPADSADSAPGTTTPAPGATGAQPGAAQTPPGEAASGAEPQGRFVPLDRFNGVVAQKYEAIRTAEQAQQRAAELERQIRDLQARVSPPATGDGTQPATAGAQPPAGPITSAELDRMATVRAQQLRFNERCNESVTLGRKAYTDFDAAVADLRKVSTMTDANGQPLLPQALIEAALETGRAHDVLYALGKDTSEADRIMSLSSNPVRQAVEVARFAQKLAPAQDDAAAGADTAGTQPSPVVVVRGQAEPPVPIRPVVGASRGVNPKDLPLDDPNLPMEEFVRRRNEDEKRRRVNGRFR